jgi:RNA 3'-terminal phosphate cyclase
MIIPFLSLSKTSSQFSTSYVSSHLQTNLDLCKFITGMNYQIDKKNKFCYIVSINP